MKKMLCIFLATVSALTFAMDTNCKDHTPDQVLKRLQSKGRNTVTVNYSPDQASLANSFQTALKNGGISVTMNELSDSGTCYFSK